MSKAPSNFSSGKGARTKPLRGPGSEPLVSAMVGGVGNMATKSAKKAGPTMSFNTGGIARTVQGGFRNAAMEHKRG